MSIPYSIRTTCAENYFAVLLIYFSPNKWDVSGAGAFGFKTIWVNRTGASWDKLLGISDHIVKSILEASNLIGSGIK